MTAIPSGWTAQPLLDLVELHDSRRIPLNQKERGKRKGPYPYYGANGQVDSIDDYIFNGDFILLAEDGGFFDDRTRGVAYEVSGQFWVNNHAHVLSVRTGVNQRYLTYALNQLDWLPYVGGSTRLKLTQEGMRRIVVPLPPPEVQRRIVAKLDGLRGHTNGARQELIRVPRLIQRYKGALITAAMAGELTEAWRQRASRQRDSWQTKTLGQLAVDVRYGTAAKCHYLPEETPVLRIPNVVAGRVDLKDLKYATFSPTETEKLSLREGDLLVIRSNGSLDLVGRTAVVPDSATGFLFAGYLIRIRFNTAEVLPEFVQYAFGEPGTRAHIESLAKSTSGVNNINSEQLKAVQFSIPQLDEQAEVVDKLTTALRAVESVGDQTRRATTLLARLEQASVARAFTGRLAA